MYANLQVVYNKRVRPNVKVIWQIRVGIALIPNLTHADLIIYPVAGYPTVIFPVWSISGAQPISWGILLYF